MPLIRELGLVLAVFGFAVTARAETCVKPDLLDTFPPNGAKNVPPNAKLTAHYEATAQYIDEDVRLVKGVSKSTSADDGESVPVTFSEDEGLLVTTPPSGLEPGERYVIKWPKLRGIGTASKGTGADVAFTVGTTEDVEPPSFEGLTSIQWDVRRTSDDCTNGIEERFVFDVTPGQASDDSGTESLALVVYQTKGGDVGTDPSKPVLTALLPKSQESVRVERPIDGAIGHVCFAAHVKDLTGKVSTGNGANKEVCVETTPPPFFYGCRVSGSGLVGPGGGMTRVAVVGFGFVVLSLRKRRRHRATP